MTADQPLPDPLIPAPADAKVTPASADAGPPCTRDGYHAGDIIAQWYRFCVDGSGVTIPSRVSARIGKEVKRLIQDGYDSNTIKCGLTVWTARFLDNPMLSPNALSQLTWKAQLDSTPQGRRFQSELKAALTRFQPTAAAVATNRHEARVAQNAGALAKWRAKMSQQLSEKEQ